MDLQTLAQPYLLSYFGTGLGPKSAHFSAPKSSVIVRFSHQTTSQKSATHLRQRAVYCKKRLRVRPKSSILDGFRRKTPTQKNAKHLKTAKSLKFTKMLVFYRCFEARALKMRVFCRCFETRALNIDVYYRCFQTTAL